MKFIAGLKKCVWIGVAGITGSFVSGLIAIALLFIVGIGGAIIAAFVPFVNHIMSKWTLDGIYLTIIGAYCVGFVFGCSAARRHLQVIQKWFAPIFVLGIFMTFGLWLAYNYANHVGFIRKEKLADCTNVMTFHLKVPRGHDYRFILAVPSGSTNQFSGRMDISDGASIVTNVNVGFSQTEQQGNFLHAETNYDIRISFNQSPPPSSSIWLYWREGYRDRHR